MFQVAGFHHPAVPVIRVDVLVRLQRVAFICLNLQLQRFSSLSFLVEPHNSSEALCEIKAASMLVQAWGSARGRPLLLQGSFAPSCVPCATARRLATAGVIPLMGSLQAIEVGKAQLCCHLVDALSSVGRTCTCADCDFSGGMAASQVASQPARCCRGYLVQAKIRLLPPCLAVCLKVEVALACCRHKFMVPQLSTAALSLNTPAWQLKALTAYQCQCRAPVGFAGARQGNVLVKGDMRCVAGMSCGWLLAHVLSLEWIPCV